MREIWLLSLHLILPFPSSFFGEKEREGSPASSRIQFVSSLFQALVSLSLFLLWCNTTLFSRMFYPFITETEQFSRHEFVEFSLHALFQTTRASFIHISQDPRLQRHVLARLVLFCTFQFIHSSCFLLSLPLSWKDAPSDQVVTVLYKHDNRTEREFLSLMPSTAILYSLDRKTK